jgi:hypothetical protein
VGGDGRDVMAGEAQLDDRAVQLRQARERLPYDQLEKHAVAVLTGLAGRTGALRFQRDRKPDVALGGAVELFLVAQFAQGDGQEQSPEVFAARHVIMTVAHAQEKGAEH